MCNLCLNNVTYKMTTSTFNSANIKKSSSQPIAELYSKKWRELSIHTSGLVIRELACIVSSYATCQSEH